MAREYVEIRVTREAARWLESKCPTRNGGRRRPRWPESEISQAIADALTVPVVSVASTKNTQITETVTPTAGERRAKGDTP